MRILSVNSAISAESSIPPLDNGRVPGAGNPSKVSSVRPMGRFHPTSPASNDKSERPTGRPQTQRPRQHLPESVHQTGPIDGCLAIFAVTRATVLVTASRALFTCTLEQFDNACSGCAARLSSPR
ncbi:unnamed protein product [Protopolystoma xenopodis]|uniref:Uncharacterized protein n=1 Tax=Protopolystoma xenopodis TaxID=117903 RepID=A0A3S4ZXX6_9PLAT|nr:unnamed protein product [Protopolystoma xenopodis]